MYGLNLQESKLCCFHEGIGVCEQLIGMPIPLSYTRLTSRFLVLWHFTLPIILWDDCHWIVVPATFISAASLFCIEEVYFLSWPPFLSISSFDIYLHRNSNTVYPHMNFIKYYEIFEASTVFSWFSIMMIKKILIANH